MKLHKHILIRKPQGTKSTMIVNFRCASLRNGDLVMVRIKKFGTNHKIADKWEQDPWEVLRQMDDSPLLTV